MKTILRNFIVTIRRFKLAASLNLLGLSIAFASMLIIIFQLSYELNFDKSINNHENIFRVEVSHDSVSTTKILPRPLIDLIKDAAPEIEYTSLITYDESKLIIDREAYSLRMYEVEPDFFKLFGQEIVAGDGSSLNVANTLFVSESFAKKVFNNSFDAIGKTVKDLNKKGSDTLVYIIGGVYKDFAKNTQFNSNPVFCKIDDNVNKTHWGNSNYLAFIHTVKDVDPRELEKKMCSKIAEEGPDDVKIKRIKLLPIKDIYFSKDSFSLPFDENGNFLLTMVLLVVAVLVVVIASINFINFATSLIPLRVKSINTQKVLGASQLILRSALVLESVIICVVAYVLSLVLIYLAEMYLDTSIFITPLDIKADVGVIVRFFFVVVGIGVIAGLYPAIATTSFKPALVLKGSFGASTEGRRLRMVLVAIQFLISIGLIIAAMVMQLQSNLLLSFDNGLSKDKILLFNLPANIVSKSYDAFVDALKQAPQITDVTSTSRFRVGLGDSYMSWGRPAIDGSGFISFACIPVAYNFVEFMGLTVNDGRGFMKEDEHKYGTYIFNEKAALQFNIKVGDQMYGTDDLSEVVGIVKDFNFKSLRYNIEPLALYQFGSKAWTTDQWIYVKVSGDPYSAMKEIDKVYKKFEDVATLDITFYDNEIEKMYSKERNLIFLITLCSVIAVLISLIGVFGLVVFETQFRRKEIGVRKVHGASISQILAMFNKQFIKIVLICFVFAAPIAWYGVTMWLDNFIQKTPIYWWVFALALLLVLFVTLVTVTVQSWRSATENPVKSIKSE